MCMIKYLPLRLHRQIEIPLGNIRNFNTFVALTRRDV